MEALFAGFLYNKPLASSVSNLQGLCAIHEATLLLHAAFDEEGYEEEAPSTTVTPPQPPQVTL